MNKLFYISIISHWAVTIWFTFAFRRNQKLVLGIWIPSTILYLIVMFRVITD